LIALAGPANRQGRLVADNIADNIIGPPKAYPGRLGMAVVRVFGLTAACTEANKELLRAAGIPFAAVHLNPNPHSGYFPGAKPLAMELLYSPETAALLGAQAVGPDEAGKPIDVFATAIWAEMTVDEVADLELCYAPPYGSAKDPVNLSGMAAQNAQARLVEPDHWHELAGFEPAKSLILDRRDTKEWEGGAIPGSVHIPLGELRLRLAELPADKLILAHCASGQRSYNVCRLLAQHGIRCRNLCGSYKTRRPERRRQQGSDRSLTRPRIEGGYPVKSAYSLTLLLLLATLISSTTAQEKSVRPGINDPFQNPDVKKFGGIFEGESREVFAKRKEIVAAVGLKPGESVADIGAGTGLFTRLFAAEVGPRGKVYAVDIAEKFLEHIAKTNQQTGIANVRTVLCKPYSAELPVASIDVAFICDTYHHFEFSFRTMASIHTALKPGGRVVLIDFRRVKGQSTDWVMNHVRAGQEVFEQEIAESGFKKVKEVKGALQENYLVVFEKVDKPGPKFVFPIIDGYGGVVPLPDAAEQPRKGTKVVFDVTAAAPEAGKPVPALERAAVLLNLAGASGLRATDLEIVLVLHGDATLAALDDRAYRARVGRGNENAELIERLNKAGVKVMVCGQSLKKKGLEITAVRADVTVAASALTAVLNHQQRGFACIRSN